MVAEAAAINRVSRRNTAAACLRDYASLCKPRILGLLAVVTVVTAVVSSGPAVPWGQVWLAALAGVLASASASILNNVLDRDIDIIMARTRHRPLARGDIQVRHALALAAGLLLLAAAVSFLVSYLVAVFVVGGALVYAVVYTYWLKRRTALNIVIGGAAGSCAVMVGWAAAGGGLTPAAVIIALLLFFWTPAHFWSFALVHSEDYRRAAVPMLPGVADQRVTVQMILLHTALMLASSLALYFYSDLGLIYLAGALLLGGWLAARNLPLWRGYRVRTAWASYKFSGIYLLGLFLSMFFDVII
ncbi:MAG: protoheme IX farnesyltransferase [Chloroflexi bacterium]|nr:protoheme IX farnesyltransferase [Chloroflexota bacterium]